MKERSEGERERRERGRETESREGQRKREQISHHWFTSPMSTNVGISQVQAWN